MDEPTQILNQPKSFSESHKLPDLVTAITIVTPLAEVRFQEIISLQSENRDQEPLQKYQAIKKGIMDFLENLYQHNQNIGYKNNADEFPYHKKFLFHIDTFMNRADLILQPALEAGIISLDVAVAQLLAIAGHDVIQDNRDLKKFDLSEIEFKTEIKGNKEKASAVVTLAFLDRFENQFKSLGLNYEKIKPIVQALILDTVPTFVPEKSGVAVSQEHIAALVNTESNKKVLITETEQKVLDFANATDFMAGEIGKTFVHEFNRKEVILNEAPLQAVRGSFLVRLENLRLKGDESQETNQINVPQIVEYLRGEEGFQNYAREQFEDNLKQIKWSDGRTPESLQNSIYPHSGEFFAFLAGKFEQMEGEQVLEIYKHLIYGQESTPAIKDLLAEFEQSRTIANQEKLAQLKNQNN